MARDRQKYVELWSPTGTQVEVNESRAEVLKGRGYTTSKPRNLGRAKRGQTNDNSAELAAKDAEIAELRKQLEAKNADGPQS